MFYIVGTPIGNLEDLSIRQAKTLLSSEYIITEDTRSTGILLKKIKELFPQIPAVKTPKLISYYKENEFEKLPEITELILEDVPVSLISQAGMPLISDPGFLLVQHLAKNSVRFEVIPGPTAISIALVHSGFNPQHHIFLGFVPRKPGDIKRLIERMNTMSGLIKDLVFVAYESPNRIVETLKIMDEMVPEADVAVCRELTKKFEEVVRGKPRDLMNREYKGEITLVLKFT